jgi:peptidyl-prolyl cis-trans isomerase SurA
MKSSAFVLSALFVFSNILFSQVSDPVLMTINGNPISRSEFEYIYNKNNSNNSLDKKTLDEYVDLFVNFKLKVEEAKTQGIDTTAAFRNELAGYRTQLTKPYLTDSKVDDRILQEAYDRMKEDVNVSHILIRVAQNASPADTLKSWLEIEQIYKRLNNGEDFTKVAKEVSQDPSVEKNGGHIGWISAFRTVYPFETAAYNTPVGTFSKPIRTAFGYHIVKVNGRRKSLGEVLVSHIMIFTSQGDTALNRKAKITIDSIYQRIKAGDDFGKLAQKYSMDKGSAAKNGELPWFGTGRMVPEFETAAFALKNIGDISRPIESPYGWHIIKLMDRRGLDTFENTKADIEQKVKRDERANMGRDAFLANLRKTYNVKSNDANLQEMAKLAGTKSVSDSSFLTEAIKLKKPVLTFADKTFTQGDFAQFLKKQFGADKSKFSDIMNVEFKNFTDNNLMSYEDSQLEKKYDDFRNLMQEYHDGILLFDISNKEVWDKASRDTTGLDNYFKNHRAVYTWEKPHYKGRVIYCKDSPTFKIAQSIVRISNVDSIDKYLRTRLNDSIQYVKIEKGLYVQGDNKAVDHFVFKTKDKYVPSKDYPFVFVWGKLLKKSPEDYTDVRGLVTADYQEFLEKEWIKSLRAKYPVEINRDVLKTIKQN